MYTNLKHPNKLEAVRHIWHTKCLDNISLYTNTTIATDFSVLHFSTQKLCHEAHLNSYRSNVLHPCGYLMFIQDEPICDEKLPSKWHPTTFPQYLLYNTIFLTSSNISHHKWQLTKFNHVSNTIHVLFQLFSYHTSSSRSYLLPTHNPRWG